MEGAGTLWENIGTMKNPLSPYALTLLKAQRRIEASQEIILGREVPKAGVPPALGILVKRNQASNDARRLNHAEQMAQYFRDDARFYKEAFRVKEAECAQLRKASYDMATQIEHVARHQFMRSIDRYKPIR
jgi:hypothetical protein